MSSQQRPARGKGTSPVTSREWHDYSTYHGRDAQPEPREIVARLHDRMAALGLIPPAGDDSTPPGPEQPDQNGEHA
jgi:hypothetical protein